LLPEFLQLGVAVSDDSFRTSHSNPPPTPPANRQMKQSPRIPSSSFRLQEDRGRPSRVIVNLKIATVREQVNGFGEVVFVKIAPAAKVGNKMVIAAANTVSDGDNHGHSLCVSEGVLYSRHPHLRPSLFLQGRKLRHPSLPSWRPISFRKRLSLDTLLQTVCDQIDFCVVVL
jgi:hypothetical protein